MQAEMDMKVIGLAVVFLVFWGGMMFLHGRIDRQSKAIVEVFHWINLFEALFEKRYNCTIERVDDGKFMVTFDSEGYKEWASRRETKDPAAN